MIKLEAIDEPFTVRKQDDLKTRVPMVQAAEVTEEQAQRRNAARKALAARYREEGQHEQALAIESQEPAEARAAVNWTPRLAVQQAMLGGVWPNRPKTNGVPNPEGEEPSARMAKIGLAVVDAPPNATIVLIPKDVELLRRKAFEAAGPVGQGGLPLPVYAALIDKIDHADGTHAMKAIQVEMPEEAKALPAE